RVEEFRVFGGLHRNLGVEDEIVRQLGEPRHQREALVAQRLELAQPRGIGSAPRLRQIVERDRIEVVVGERDESKSETAQLDDLADDAIDAALARLLSVGPPHGTERAMLRAAAQRLYRRPHVPPLRKQIPSRRHELIACDAAPFVDRPRLSSQALLDDARPDDVAVAAHDRVRLTVSRGFVRKQRGMNAAEDDPGTALAHLASDLVTAERVAGMNADADDVARANRVEIDRIERFVDDDRIAPAAAGRRREDVEPARRNHGDAERFHTRIDEMNAWQVWTSSRGKGFVRAWSGVAERSENQERSVYAGSTRARVTRTHVEHGHKGKMTNVMSTYALSSDRGPYKRDRERDHHRARAPGNHVSDA